MPELCEAGLGEPDRPNVVVYGGYDVSGNPLVVFLDRYEQFAFHSELAFPEYKELFPGL